MTDKENKSGNCTQKSDFGCAVCMKTSRIRGKRTGVKMMSCSNCRGPRRYCSKECFQKDWNELGHKEECKMLTSVCLTEDPKLKAAEVMELKNKANELFQAKKYEEAICKYAEVKAIAIKIRKTIKELRKQQGGTGIICSYLQNIETTDGKLEAELQISHRNDPLETEMGKLSAIAANNSAITYNKMNMRTEAAAAAREALKLDPRFAQRVLPQLLSSLQSLGAKSEWKEMAERFVMLQDFIGMGFNEGCALFNTDFISYKELVKIGNMLFYEIIDEEKKLAEEGCCRFLESFNSPKVIDKWGHVTVLVSMVPIKDAQWLALSIQNVRSIMNTVFVEHMNLRIRPADLKRSDDEVDANCIPGYRPGLMSHVGSLEALKNAHREIILFVHDIEREGLAVNMVVLGTGLFNLLLEDKDPQKDQRKHKNKGDKYILHPGQHLPEYCKIVPAENHIRRQ